MPDRVLVRAPPNAKRFKKSHFYLFSGLSKKNPKLVAKCHPQA